MTILNGFRTFIAVDSKMAVGLVSRKEKFEIYNGLVCLAQGIEGSYTTVDLRNESCVTGKIEQVDGYMNVMMSEAVFIDARGTEFPFDSFFIHARNVRYIHIPEESENKRFTMFAILNVLLFISDKMDLKQDASFKQHGINQTCPMLAREQPKINRDMLAAMSHRHPGDSIHYYVEMFLELVFGYVEIKRV